MIPLPEQKFDLIINCSTIEHVGLAGRFGVSHNKPDEDLEAMEHLKELMKPGGSTLITIPVGRDAVFAPLHSHTSMGWGVSFSGTGKRYRSTLC